jgi:hypothetical protein
MEMIGYSKKWVPFWTTVSQMIPEKYQVSHETFVTLVNRSKKIVELGSKQNQTSRWIMMRGSS